MPWAVRVRPIQPGTGTVVEHPVQERPVVHVHLQGDLRLKTIAPKMALPDEDAEEEALGEGSSHHTYAVPCFTVCSS
jgi:hypothetical protein